MTIPRTAELVPSVSIENLLSRRDAMAERLRKVAALLFEVEELSRATFGDADAAAPRLECRRVHASIPGSIETLVKRVDAVAWNHLMCESGLWTFMDRTARAQWQKDIDDLKVPELTPESIEETFKDLFAARQEMFERGVVECFRRLSWDYKTNKPCFFGKRIIVTYLVESHAYGGSRYVTGPSYNNCNYLDDLIRVMTVLDGKPEPDHRQGSYRAIGKVINFDSRHPPWPDVELGGGMLKVRCFLNGNGHVTFLRPDLVEKLNAILAKHHPGALPPHR
jgi:hypothetical protein